MVCVVNHVHCMFTLRNRPSNRKIICILYMRFGVSTVSAAIWTRRKRKVIICSPIPPAFHPPCRKVAERPAEEKKGVSGRAGAFDRSGVRRPDWLQAASLHLLRESGNTKDVADGRIDVVANSGDAADCSGFDPGTGDNEWNADTRFPDGGLVATQRAIDIARLLQRKGSVIGGVEDVRVVTDSQLLDVGDQLSDTIIHILDHRPELRVLVTRS